MGVATCMGVEGSGSFENARRMPRYMLSMMKQARAVASMGDPFIEKNLPLVECVLRRGESHPEQLLNASELG